MQIIRVQRKDQIRKKSSSVSEQPCQRNYEDNLRNSAGRGFERYEARIEEEGMIPRVIKILDTSDVCFMALEAAKSPAPVSVLSVQIPKELR